MGAELDTLKYLAPLGVGGILAYAMFLIYRKDSAKWAAQETGRADTMTQIVKENTAAVSNNTAAVNHLTDYIRKNGGGAHA